MSELVKLLLMLGLVVVAYFVGERRGKSVVAAEKAEAATLLSSLEVKVAAGKQLVLNDLAALKAKL